tara:strand:+ start:3948 stop:4211 length:264 start_codon:yes stop_codon:yes gene_type:complete
MGLLEAIYYNKDLQHLSDHYEVRKALQIVRGLIAKSEKERLTLREHLLAKDFTLTDVIDEVIDINALIGVGIISLGDDLKEYCYAKK